MEMKDLKQVGKDREDRPKWKERPESTYFACLGSAKKTSRRCSQRLSNGSLWYATIDTLICAYSSTHGNYNAGFP